MGQEEELIHLDDFKSIRLKIGITNNTTQIRIEDGKRYFSSGGKEIPEENTKSTSRRRKEEDLSIQFVEFTEDNGLVLDAPLNTCAQGHHLTIHIVTDNVSAKDLVDFSGTAKVASREVSEGGRDILQLTLIQFDEGTWRKLRDVYSARQNDILAFFEAAKG